MSIIRKQQQQPTILRWHASNQPQTPISDKIHSFVLPYKNLFHLRQLKSYIKQTLVAFVGKIPHKVEM